MALKPGASYSAFAGYDSRIEGYAGSNGRYAMSFAAAVAFAGPDAYETALAYN